MFSKLRSKNKISILLVVGLLLIFSTTLAFSAETENANEYAEQLQEIISASSAYSDFQTSMLIKFAQSLIDSVISYGETEEILKNSVSNALNAYNIKKVFDVIQKTQEEGLPPKPLINKFNEGLAKNIDNNTIMNVISIRAENLEKAGGILAKAKEAGLEVNGGEELLKILTDSLENDVPENSLSWLLDIATFEGKNVQEIAEISEEFSYLSLMASDLGLSPDEVADIFNKAIESDTAITDIFANIQSNLEMEISAAKADSSSGKTSTGSSSSTSSSSTIDISSDAGETPIQDAGEPPSQTGGISEPSTSPGEDTPPPPEN